jgi:hypothetical protein
METKDKLASGSLQHDIARAVGIYFAPVVAAVYQVGKSISSFSYDIRHEAQDDDCEQHRAK